MNRRRTWYVLVVVLLIASVTQLCGARKKPAEGDNKMAATTSSITKGAPPPGNAMAFSVPQARTVLEEAIKKRYIGKIKSCSPGSLIKICSNYVLSEATDVRVQVTRVDLATSYTDSWNAPNFNFNGRVHIDFSKKRITLERRSGKTEPDHIDLPDYLQAYRPDLRKATWEYGEKVVYPIPLYSVGYLPSPENSKLGPYFVLFAWPDEAAAQEFADAFNRLLYAVYRNEEDPEFRTAAQVWRDNPAKAPLSPEADRHRILAENALKEKNLDAAIEHYESGLEVQPMWPAGWFNLAIIYAEQNNYADATDRMKHYLELAPDAPDAKDAREQMIIWEEKAKHGT